MAIVKVQLQQIVVDNDLKHILRKEEAVFRTPLVGLPFVLYFGPQELIFSDSPQEATASATVYSTIDMIKANHLDIYKF